MLIIFIILTVILIGFVWAAISGAPWVPAFKRDLEKILDDSKLEPGQLFIELGCGDGRLLQVAAQRGSVVIGYELNPLLWLISYLRLWRYPAAQVHLGNFWQADISGADVVLAFLVPRTMARLETKVCREMKTGSRLVSYIFELPNKKPVVKRHHWLIYDF